MKKTRKILALVCALSLTAALAVGGTLAYLADKTDAVVNTFTVGKVDITLAEKTGSDYKMVPGSTIAKDPKVTVVAGSEDCWLFVKIDESANLDSFISYTVAGGWTELDATNHPGVYYREAKAGDEFYVLAGSETNPSGEVTVLGTVTNKMMADATGDNAPKLTVTAYAVQKANVASAADAWTQANNAANFPTTGA